MQRKQYLLQKYLARQCNRSELEELFRYLREEPVGNDYDEVIRNIWDELYSDQQLSAEGSEALFRQISVRLPRRSRRSYAGWRVAAGLTGVTVRLLVGVLSTMDERAGNAGRRLRTNPNGGISRPIHRCAKRQFYCPL